MQPPTEAKPSTPPCQLESVLLNFSSTAAVPFYMRVGCSWDHVVFRQIFQELAYDIDKFQQSAGLAGVARAAQAAGKELLIVDAGANIGAASVYFSGHYPGSRVVAVEPEHKNYHLLHLNSQGHRIEPLEAALGSETGSGRLLDPGAGEVGFRLDAGGDREVAIVSMDQILADHPAAKFTPFICKIDIEGGEADVFAKNTDWLAKFPVVIVELHDWMLPRQSISRNFFKSILKFNFDLLIKGENLVCYNTNLLSGFSSP